MRRQFPAVAFGVFALCGCAGRAALPPVPTIIGAENVEIVDAEASLSACANLGRVQAVDGLVGTGRLHYVGTMERAELLLKNEALRFNADTLLIVDVLESLVGSTRTGYRIALTGMAYQCRGGPFRAQSR
jgi:hypothetical protein